MSCAHYLPFMMPGANGEISLLFSQVVNNMASIHKGGNIKALINLATEWLVPSLQIILNEDASLIRLLLYSI